MGVIHLDRVSNTYDYEQEGRVKCSGERKVFVMPVRD